MYILQGVVAKYFSYSFLLFKNATNLASGHHACSPTRSQISIDIHVQ